MLGIFFNCSPSYFFRVSVNLELGGSATLASQHALKIFLPLRFPFAWALVIELRSSCLCDKHLIN